MKIFLQRGDVTQIHVGAIVNAANRRLVGGGGVDGAIHRAGGPAIAEACRRIREASGGCPPGRAVATTAGNLPSRVLIHTVGPVWAGGTDGEDATLEDCYRNSLQLAAQLDIADIAFPNISTGVYGFPKRRAAEIATRAVASYGDKLPRTVHFVCYDAENYLIYKDLLPTAESDD